MSQRGPSRGSAAGESRVVRWPEPLRRAGNRRDPVPALQPARDEVPPAAGPPEAPRAGPSVTHGHCRVTQMAAVPQPGLTRREPEGPASETGIILVTHNSDSAPAGKAVGTRQTKCSELSHFT